MTADRLSYLAPNRARRNRAPFDAKEMIDTHAG